MVSILLLMDGELHLQRCSGREHLPVPPTYFDAYPQPWSWCLQLPCWYRSPAQSERGQLSSRMPNGSNRTYVKDVKDPEKVLLPSRDLVLVALRDDEPDHCIPLPLLD